MAELKTQRNDADVGAFLDAIADPTLRAEGQAVAALMQELTGEPPAMWGASIVGFGSLRYRYASGREGEWFRLGFAPRGKNLTLYLPAGFAGREDLVARLTSRKTGVSCLPLRRLADVDAAALRELLTAALTSDA